MIAIEGLRKTYPGSGAVLDGLALSVEEGEAIALVGRSGAGKTSLLNVIGGLDRAYEGRVAVGGQALEQLSDRRLSAFRNQTIGFVFQGFHLLPHLTALENVLLPTFFEAGERGAAAAVDRARQALQRVDLPASGEGYPGRLSGGQRQRRAIARALVSGPRLLLCDEPTGNLDTQTGEAILDLLVGLRESEGLTLVFVTHEARVSSRADRVLALAQGKLHEQENPS